MAPHSEITRLLADLGDEDPPPVDALLPLLYDELHALARRQLRGERPDHTLNTTALVHEAYLKLVDQTRVTWRSRAHFLGVAAIAMRRLLINHARRKSAGKRGAGLRVVTFEEEAVARETRIEELLAVDEALERLSLLNPRQARVVECRFFGGLKDAEIAEVLRVSVPTVRRDWRFARAWLARELA